MKNKLVNNVSKQKSFMSLFFLDGKKIVRGSKFLREMDKVIPYERLIKLMNEKYTKNNVKGRPQYPLELMLKIHILQNLYNLSDEGTEDEIYDRLSFQEYLKIDKMSDRIPDSTTIEKFRHFLNENKFQDKIFEEINKLLREKGMFLNKGTIVDATIIKASSSTKNKEKKRDEEMGSTRKNNNYYFGAKVHTGVDVDSGLVHTITMTSANVSDITERDKLLTGEERTIFGDKAYGDKKLKDKCRKGGIYYGITEKKAKNKKLSKTQKKKNNKKSSVRAKVEHPFRIMKCIFGYTKVKFRGIEKNKLAVMFKMALANLYLVRKKITS